MDKKLDKIGFIIYKIDYIKNKFFWGGGDFNPPPFLPLFFYDYLCEICSKVANIEEKITLTQSQVSHQ